MTAVRQVRAPVLFEYSFPANAHAVHDTLRQVRHALQEQSHPAAAGFSWELGLAEAMNNIVEHAYSGSGKGKIGLSLVFTDAQLTARFSDKGRAMPQGGIPAPKDPDLDVAREDLPEGGFGWTMIHALASEVAYRRIDGVNHLTMRLPLDE